MTAHDWRRRAMACIEAQAPQNPAFRRGLRAVGPGSSPQVGSRIERACQDADGSRWLFATV